MIKLKQWGKFLLQQAGRFWPVTKPVTEAAKRIRRQRVYDKMEAERLDRIRNPSKYLGK